MGKKPKGATADAKTHSQADMERKTRDGLDTEGSRKRKAAILDTKTASDAETLRQPETEDSRKGKAADLKSRKKKRTQEIQPIFNKEANSLEDPDPAVSTEVVLVQACDVKQRKEKSSKTGLVLKQESLSQPGDLPVAVGSEAVQAHDVKEQKKKRGKDYPSTSKDQEGSPVEPSMPGQVLPPLPGDLRSALKEGKLEKKGEQKLEPSKESAIRKSLNKGKASRHQTGGSEIAAVEETLEAKVEAVEEPEPEEQPPEAVDIKAMGNKTLCVGNLPYNIQPEEFKGIFTQAGYNVADYLLPCHGGVIRGFGYVEFASSVEAKKVLDSLDNLELMGRRISLETSFENISDKRGSHLKENWGVRMSITVKGLDTSLKEDEVKKSLEEHFAECKIKHIRVRGHIDNATGEYSNEGIAVVDFIDTASFSKAKELNKVPLNGNMLEVSEARYMAGVQGYYCVPCGGTGILCTACGAVVGGRGPVRKTAWVGTGSDQAGSANLPGPSNQMEKNLQVTPPMFRGRGPLRGRGRWGGAGRHNRGRWGRARGHGAWRGR